MAESPAGLIPLHEALGVKTGVENGLSRAALRRPGVVSAVGDGTCDGRTLRGACRGELHGIGGLHRLYLGKTTSGWIHLCTMNLCFFALVWDCKALPGRRSGRRGVRVRDGVPPAGRESTTVSAYPTP